MKVQIYLETSNQSQGRCQRKYGYVIETLFQGEAITREGFGETEGTLHECTLQALMEALERFRKECSVCVHTRDLFVAARLKKIEELQEAGFKDSKGNPLKNAEEWKAISEKIKEISIQISAEPGKHSYSTWLTEEMKNGIMGKGMEPQSGTESGSNDISGDHS